MKNFVFHNPTKILFGKNTIASLGAEVSQYGKTVLLVYGRQSIKHNGIYEKLLRSLQDTNCTITEYSGIAPNPTLSMVHKGIELYRNNRCEVICGVGGGSVLDVCKAISCGVPVQHDVWKFFTTKKSVKAAIPLICVATIAGSGSENNSGMVITNDITQQKFGFGNKHLHPKVSILDPQFTFSVSPFQTATGCVDILTHLIEFYCSNSVDLPRLQWFLHEGIIRSVMDNCEQVLKEPENYDCRAQLMWASALSLGGIPAAGLGRIGFPVHLIEHSISALFNTTHGAGLAVLLPAWMDYESTSQPQKIAELGRNIFGLTGSSAQTVANETASHLKSWFKKIGCPVTLEELGVRPDNYAEIAENAQQLARIWRLQNYSSKTITDILNLC